MSRFCTVCGAALEEGAGFCSSCGAPLQQSQPPVENPSADTRQPYPEQTGYPPVQQSNQPPQPQQSYQPMQQPAPPYRYSVPVNAGVQTHRVASPVAPGSTGSKGHLALGIIVTVSIVVLIIAAIVLFIIFNPFKFIDSPQKALDKQNSSFYNTAELDAQGYLSVDYEYHFVMSADEKKEAPDRLREMHTSWRKYNTEEFGDDVTVTSEILDEETLKGVDLRNTALDYCVASTDEPEAFFDEIKRARVRFTEKGSKKTESFEYSVIFLKKDGKWYIGDWDEYTSE